MTLAELKREIDALIKADPFRADATATVQIEGEGAPRDIERVIMNEGPFGLIIARVVAA